MRIGVVTLFPEMLKIAEAGGVITRGLADGRMTIQYFNPRKFAQDARGTVDARPFGGGPGMVMQYPPVAGAVAAARIALPDVPVIALTPQGRALTQKVAGELARLPGMILLAGRYEGMDERVTSLVDDELSVGDYVLSGGELPALVTIDTVCRLLPGLLGNANSIIDESHLDGLLEYPQYTRPEKLDGTMVPNARVPEVLTGGNHQKIARWRRTQALIRTFERRPELLSGRLLGAEDRALLAQWFRSDCGE